MPATSLKLPDELKRRVAALVSETGQSAHAFMVEAIEQAAQREELRRPRSGAGTSDVPAHSGSDHAPGARSTDRASR